jgi:hypothetical protein
MPSIFVPSHTGRSRPRALTGVTVFALLLVALGSGFLNAQNGNSREIPVVYETLTGKRQGVLTPVTSETRELPIGDSSVALGELIGIEFSGKIADSAASATLVLRGGGFWRGRLDLRRLTDGEQVFWNCPSLTRVLEIPLESIQRYLSAGAPGDSLESAEQDSDQLLTTDGARLSGILESLDSTGVSFDDESLGLLKIEWAKVLAFQLIALDESTEDQAATGPSVHIVARDGSSPIGTLIQLDSEEIRFRSVNDQEVRMPTDRLLRIEFPNDRVVDLTDRTPATVEEGLGKDRWFPWTWRRDRNVLGTPLTIGARTFDRGIGVHSNSLLTFSIEDGDATLSGYAGMDASSRPRDDEPEIGNARFSILVDGETVWGPHDLSWQNAPRPFSIPLKNGKTFSLKVEMGSGIHILDRANWVSTRIIRD